MRPWTCALVVVFALPSVGARCSFAEEHAAVPVTVARLSDRVAVFTVESIEQAHVTAVATRRGLCVIDTTNSPADADRIRRMIESEFGRTDFAFVINTHHHLDHWFGNQAFKEGTIISHVAARDRMRAIPAADGHPLPNLLARAAREEAAAAALPEGSDEALRLRGWASLIRRVHSDLIEGFEPALPTVVFSDRLTLHMDDVTLTLYFFGNAETDNNIVVHIPEEALLIVGDIFGVSRILSDFDTYDGLDIDMWLSVLNALLEDEENARHVVGGHEYIWPARKLIARRDYIAAVWKSVVRAREAGWSLDQAVQRLAPKEFPQLQWIGLEESLREKGSLRDNPPERQHEEIIEMFWRQHR